MNKDGAARPQTTCCSSMPTANTAKARRRTTCARKTSTRSSMPTAPAKTFPAYARRVPKAEIVAEDYNCNIRRYVDNAPPPEPHDVRAHLHGGVPKAEVEPWRTSGRTTRACGKTASCNATIEQPISDFAPASSRQTRHRRPRRQPSRRHRSGTPLSCKQLEDWWQAQPAPCRSPGAGCRKPAGTAAQRLRPAPQPAGRHRTRPSPARTCSTAFRCAAPSPTMSISSRPTSNPSPPAAGGRN